MVRVSQDEQGKGHLKVFRDALSEGVPVIVDRMNFNWQQRNRYVHDAMECGYHIVFVLFDISRQICLSRMSTRKDHPSISIDDDHEKIIDFYFRSFEPPTIEEYDELLTVQSNKYANILDLQNYCYNKKVIVVGDIHGCYDEFMDLLHKCGYCPGDIVVATGDLVDRGPLIDNVIWWFYNTPGAYTVEGNHSNKAKRYWRGNPVKIKHGLDKTIEQVGDNESRYAKLLSAWIDSWPQVIRLRNLNKKPMYVVHAGVDGLKPMEKQRRETCLYARYLYGTSFFDEEGILWWETLDGSYVVASGHIISDESHPCQDAYCLDGGACQGGVLRALVVENGECTIHEIASQQENDDA